LETPTNKRGDGPAEGNFIEKRAIVETWTYECRYAHPGDALMLRDGSQSIDLTMAICKKLCENLPYIIYLLSKTIYETSK
jgi:hypothetical protein